MLKSQFMGVFVVCAIVLSPYAYAANAEFETAIANTRANCDGIYDELRLLQTWAGVNVGVTGAGTLAGGGAVYAGFKKQRQDKLAEQIAKQLENIETMSDEQFLHLLGMMADYNAETDRGKLQDELTKVEKKSKNLGNWRTGLMAGNTATNIAGAVIAQKNKNAGKDVIDIVRACMISVEELKAVRMQARLDGASENDLVSAREIIDKCGKHDIRLLEKIPRRSDAAKWSAIVGIGTGASGTITSAIANADKTRNNNSDAGKNKEKNLNAASNVLAIASTAVSGTATGFNIATITAINKAMETANDCEYALR
jgi:hypothetical protein